MQIIQERVDTPIGDQVIGCFSETQDKPRYLIACHIKDRKKVFHIKDLEKSPDWWALSSYIHVDILMNYKFEFVLEKDYA